MTGTVALPSALCLAVAYARWASASAKVGPTEISSVPAASSWRALLSSTRQAPQRLPKRVFFEVVRRRLRVAEIRIGMRRACQPGRLEGRLRPGEGLPVTPYTGSSCPHRPPRRCSCAFTPRRALCSSGRQDLNLRPPGPQLGERPLPVRDSQHGVAAVTRPYGDPFGRN